MQIIGKIYKGVYGCLLINWDFIRKFGGEKRCLGKIFKKVREEEGRCFGEAKRWGSVERGRRLGCGGDFKKVRENIGLVFVCRK